MIIMNMPRMRSSVAGILAGLSTLTAVQCTAQVFLTEATLFFADSQGNVGGHNWWLTMPSSAYRLWLKDGGVFGSSFINAQGGSEVQTHVELTPGTYTIGLLCEPGGLVGYHGVNLFFNGSLERGISVFGPDLMDLSDPHIFSANPSLDTISYSPDTTPGSLSFTSGNVQVTLTDYHFGPGSLYNTDQVWAYSPAPSGALDYAGSLTLEVTAVPEPQTLALVVGLGLAGLALQRRMRVANR